MFLTDLYVIRNKIYFIAERLNSRKKMITVDKIKISENKIEDIEPLFPI